MGPPLLVWDEGMLGYDLGGHHPLHPVRWELTWALARALRVTESFQIISPEPADDHELCTIHTRDYVAAVRAASAAAERSHGGAPAMGRAGPAELSHGLGTPDNPIFAHMHSSAAQIAGGSVAAARAIARRQVDSAVNFFGGLHHAMADSASGFCVYNDAALAIRTMLDEGVQRVAYIDVDVHHGDGVQTAFYDDPRVLTVSIHESPLSLFPGTGWTSEIGRGGAEGTAVNIPLPAGTSDEQWLRAFHAVVPGVVRAFRPEVLVTQHGADSHREDPLADLNLSLDGMRTSYLAIRDLAQETTGGRWLALGGGGYALVRVVPRAWTHLLAIVAGRELDPATALPDSWLERAAAARPGTPLPVDLSDGARGAVPFRPWDGTAEVPVDRTIQDIRNLVYPLHGLDPHDPRD